MARYYENHSNKLEGFMRNILGTMDNRTQEAFEGGKFKFSFDDCPQYKNQLKKYVKEMKKFVKKRNEDILNNMEEEIPLSFNDGDQSLVKDIYQQYLLKERDQLKH